MQDWLTLYEEQQTTIHESSQSWWDDEAPIDKADVGVIAGLLENLARELDLLQGVDTFWPPSEIEPYAEKVNESVKELADSYSDDQVQFAIDYLSGKYA